MACIDKCSCGRTKKCEESKCFDCDEILRKYDITYKAVTTGTCKTHNTFFTIPGGSCSKCKIDVSVISDALSKQFEPEQKSARYNTGKTQTREIDPDFILGIGEVLTKSREKYDHFNWTRATKLSTPYESMMRHILAFQCGEDIDPDDGCSHLLKAATNLMFMHYHITNNPEESDDRFFKKGKKK